MIVQASGNNLDPRSGSITVGMGDGSVKNIASNISSATWASICDPRDGVPVSDY
jgi:hypothetical protein